LRFTVASVGLIEGERRGADGKATEQRSYCVPRTAKSTNRWSQVLISLISGVPRRSWHRDCGRTTISPFTAMEFGRYQAAVGTRRSESWPPSAKRFPSVPPTPNVFGPDTAPGQVAPGRCPDQAVSFS